MSVHVNEFLRKKGKNDLQYIELLEEALKNQKEITGKAVAKIRELEKEKAEIRAKAIEEFAKKASDKIGKFVLEHQDQLDFISGVGFGWKIIEEVEEELKKNLNEVKGE